MPHSIEVCVWSGCGLGLESESTSTFGTPAVGVNPPPPKDKRGEPDQNGQTHDSSHVHREPPFVLEYAEIEPE